ncbi:MAG: beta-galactosidase small subunit, partial [Phycisphaerae bacterium]
DNASGTLASLQLGGRELLHAGPLVNLWRAPTDNDGVKQWSGQADKPLGRWLEAGLDTLQPRCVKSSVRRSGDGSVTFRAEHVASAAGRENAVLHRSVYTVLPGGCIRVENTIIAARSLPDLPRVGVKLALAPGLETVEYFGRGPIENYIDRNACTPVGRYATTVTEMYVPYIVPQECGNRTDTRWLTLSNDHAGLLVAAEDVLEFSALHFSDRDLYDATHTWQLDARPETYLTLDARNRGLGGRSCGPDTLEKYRVEPGTWRLTFTLVPYAPAQTDPAELARKVR